MINFDSDSVRRWLGPNLEKGKRNWNAAYNKALNDFKAKYPFANISQFEIWPSINSQGDIDRPTEIVYKGDGNTKLYNETGTNWSYSWNIDSITFKNKYQHTLVWGPANGIFQPSTNPYPVKLSEGKLGFNTLQFGIYVSKDQSFTSNFPNLETN